MTDRHAGFLVVLERDLRSDDAAATLAALRQVRGVLSVEPIVAVVFGDVAEQRVRHELFRRVLDLLDPSKRTLTISAPVPPLAD